MAPDWALIRKQWYRFLACLRMCPRCQLTHSHVDIVCVQCWNELKELIREPLKISSSSYDYAMDVYALFHWTEELDHEIRKLIYLLKHARSGFLYEKLAIEFLWRRVGRKRPLSPDAVMIPSPPRQIGNKDHAYFLAEKFSQLTHWPIVNCLHRVFSGEQKLRSVNQRQKVQHVLENRLLNTKNLGRIIFVDDVITSGATARAAFHALGRPKAFEVWALAFRPKLQLRDFEGAAS